jgi:biotin carboxyl carrier protein
VLATLPSGWRNSVMPPERAEYRHGEDTVAVSYARQRDGRFAVTVTGAGPAPDGAPDSGAGPAPDDAPGSGESGLDGSAGPDSARPDSAVPDSAPNPAITPATPATSASSVCLVTVRHVGDGWIDFDAGGQRHRLHVLAAGDQVWVQGPDGDVALTMVPRFPESGRGEAVAGGLVAPMPGTVLAVHVAPGDTVAQGQLLMIVEAMKMEHRITAPAAGTVGAVRARPGDQVNGGDLLAVLDEAT